MYRVIAIFSIDSSFTHVLLLYVTVYIVEDDEIFFEYTFDIYTWSSYLSFGLI